MFDQYYVGQCQNLIKRTENEHMEQLETFKLNIKNIIVKTNTNQNKIRKHFQNLKLL